MKKTQKEIGAIIKAARRKQGLTQIELSEMLFGHRLDQMIRKMESGEKRPPYERLRDLASILQIDLGDLIP